MSRRTSFFYFLLVFATINLGVNHAAAAATEKTLHRFAPFSHGEFPYGLTEDGSGNFYGTTERGGEFNLGMVYKISPKPQGGWTTTAIYSFRGAAAPEIHGRLWKWIPREISMA